MAADQVTSKPSTTALPAPSSERVAGQLTVHFFGDRLDASAEQSSSSGFDFVPLDRGLRRGFQEYTLTHESMPDLVAVAQALTQGSLPDLQEGSVEETISERPSDGSMMGRMMSERSERSDRSVDYSDNPPMHCPFGDNEAADMSPQESRPRGRLAEPGAEVPVRSSSVGSVRGVVTDSNDEHVKVMYFINSKACFKTIGRDEYLREFAARSSSDTTDDVFDNSPTGSRTRNSRAPPLWNSQRSEDSPRSAIVWGSENSDDSRSLWTQEAHERGRDPPEKASASSTRQHRTDRTGNGGKARLRQQERGRSREKQEKKPLGVGSVVTVRSSSLARCVEGIVTDLSSDRVMVQYFWNGRSCTKSMPRSAVEFEE